MNNTIKAKTLSHEDMRKLGVEYLCLVDKYETTVRNYIRAFYPLDSEDEFWALLEKLRGTLQQRKLKDSEHGCNEFVRSLCFDKTHAWPACANMNDKELAEAEIQSWTTAARFLASYNRLVARLSKRLDQMPGLERGDDGFGDLCDSMPLAGREVADGILKEDIETYKQLEAAIPEEWRKFALFGENYIATYIMQALTKYYAIIVHSAARCSGEIE